MNPKITQACMSLEEIARRKASIRRQINSQKVVIGRLTGELLAPVKPATTKAESALRLFNTGFAVFDGLVMGVKIMRRIQRLVRRFA